jgi:hypothetical protein
MLDELGLATVRDQLAARADVCHFDLDPSGNPLWNVEAFDVGEGCK